jgi:H+/Cl- antiporter ClcA
MNLEKKKVHPLKWIFICVLIGFIWLCLGLLLVALEWAAQYRGQNNWIIWLPIGGLLIGLGYHYYGKEAGVIIYYWKNTKLHKRRFL